MAGLTYPQMRTASAPAASEPGVTSLRAAFMVYDEQNAEDTGPQCAARLESVLRQWEQAHRRLWPCWIECGGMTYADQYGNYSAETRQWAPRDPAPEKKVTRIELNHMQPICSDVGSLQCQDLPNFRATSGNDTLASASAQQAADQLVWWMWEQGGYDDKNAQIREAAAVFGNWFLYPLWDASAGRLVDTVVGYETQQAIDPMTGMPSGASLKPVTEKRREGAFADRLVSCFAALPDPAAKDEWDGEGFAIHERLPLGTMHRLYPHLKDKLVVDRTSGASDGTFYDERLKGASPRVGGLMGSASQEQTSEAVSVYTIFLRTCDEFYRGRWAVIACGQVCYMGDNPVYPTDIEEQRGEEFPQYHWPVWRATHFLVPGSYFGQGVAVRLLGPQRKLNGVASKKLHMLKRVSHPILVKPKRADFIKSDEPDQQINVTDTLPPGSIYYLNAPVFPQELQTEEQNSVAQMEHLAGVHPGSRGESQSGDSGTKTRQLFARDLGRLARPKYRTDRQLAQAFSYKLRLWRRYATSARTIRIVGENNEVAVRSMDMATIAAGTDVIVYEDAQMPKEPAARMIHYEKAIQLGIVDMKDPVQRQSAAQALGMGTYRHFESTLYVDRQRAMDENLRMYQGDVPTVEFWHDDLQDLAAHFAEMNTARWRLATTPAPGDSPQVAMQKARVRAIYLAHVQAHQLRAQMKQFGGAAQMPPGPGAPPGPPPPNAAGPAMPGPSAPPPANPLAQVPPPTNQASAGPPMQMAA